MPRDVQEGCAKPVRRYRLLIVATHVVQYSSPLFRQMAQHPQLDIRSCLL